MKTIKLTKKMLSMDPVDFLKKIGAVSDNRAFPQHVYVSKQDYKILENGVRKLAKKQYRGCRKQYIDNVVGFEMLNYGPNQTLEDVLKPGYAIVDFDCIAAEIKDNEEE
jgi:hypothetical protein